MGSLITSHVLDLVRGKPAHGIGIILEFQSDQKTWTELARGMTNTDGRAMNLLPDAHKLTRGFYRLTFQTLSYFQSEGIYSIYPYVTVVFEVQDAMAHYHIPLLLSPHGYSTYRGS